MRLPGCSADSAGVQQATGRPALTRRWAFVTAGLAAGFSGLAVLATILAGVPLLLAELTLLALPITAIAVIIRRTPRPVVLQVWRVARAGLVAGFAATLVYDLTRTALSVAEPSPYNPFEAIRRFGLGILPADAPLGALIGVGFGVHVLNGSTFGVIYATFAGRFAATARTAMVSGLAWGLTLEFIQSILYPGWLNITSVLGEFLIISGAGHLAYGATLGLGTYRLLHRQRVSDGGPQP
jgi:hypothetical protein